MKAEGETMAFTQEIKKIIQEYALRDLPNEQWHIEHFFPFLKEAAPQLWDRLRVEFSNARFIYKIFEGLQAQEELLLAQIKTQVVMYVSIQEAVVNYILFEKFKHTGEVKQLLTKTTYKKISIPTQKREKLGNSLEHNGKDIIPTYMDDCQVPKEKVRYEHKVDALYNLNLISEKLKCDLTTLYEYRNTVHLESEMKKQLTYDLGMGELAYRRVQGLSIELTKSIDEK